MKLQVDWNEYVVKKEYNTYVCACVCVCVYKENSIETVDLKLQ